MVTSPPVSDQLIDYPFRIIVVADIVERLGISLWEQCVIIGLICPQQPHMKCRVHSASFKLVGEIEHICMAHNISSHNLHQSYVFRDELPGSPLGHGQVPSR